MVINYFLFILIFALCKNRYGASFNFNKKILVSSIGIFLITCISIFIYTLILIDSGYASISVVSFQFLTEFKKILNLIYIYTGVSLFEEYLFRYIIFNKLKQSVKKESITIIVVAVLFSLVHFASYSKNPFMISDYISAFLISIVFSLSYIRNGSLIPPIVMHTVWNILLTALNLDKEIMITNSLFGISIKVVDINKIEYTLSVSIIIAIIIAVELLMLKKAKVHRITSSSREIA